MFRKAGIEILTPFNTEIGKKYKLGCFDIIPLPAIHNVECRSFLIQVDGINILFATDTNKLPKIKNVKIHHFIVEVNYIEKIVDALALKDNTNMLVMGGILKNHHSLESCIEYFKELDYKPTSITTIHKSNSGVFDKKRVIEELQEFTKNVNVAQNKTDYVLEEI